MIGDDPELPPTIPPVPRADWTPEVLRFFGIVEGPQAAAEGTRFNVQAVMANHLPLCSAWNRYNVVLTRETALPAALREIAILRTAWLLDAGYEWHQHRVLARRHGLPEDKLEAVRDGAAARLWTDSERLVLRTADEMVQGKAATPDTMARLTARLGTQQTMELLWTIASYGALAWVFNSMRVPIEDWILEASAPA